VLAYNTAWELNAFEAFKCIILFIRFIFVSFIYFLQQVGNSLTARGQQTYDVR